MCLWCASSCTDSTVEVSVAGLEMLVQDVFFRCWNIFVLGQWD